MHARVVVVEAGELEPPRADLVARPGLERGDGGLACGYGRDVELADGGEAARQVLERSGQIASPPGASARSAKTTAALMPAARARACASGASAASAMPIAVDRDVVGVAVRPGTNDWCHSSLTA